MSEEKKKYHCFECNKYYKSRSSLSHHRKRFHKNVNIITPDNTRNNTRPHPITPEITPDNTRGSIQQQSTGPIVKRNKLQCKYCQKEFKFQQGKSRHELYRCKKNKNVKKDEQIKKLKLQVQKLMNEKCKMHYKTLNKINNNLRINNGNQINKNNCIEYINNVHNQNKINVNIIELGKENIFDVLSERERLNILKHRYGSIEKLIQHVHFNDKYPQFQNIIVTNINNNIAYKYDKQSNQFQAIEKSRLLETIFDSRSSDVESFYEVDRNKLLERDKNALDQLLDLIHKDDKQAKAEKYKKIKIIAHNNLSKILKKYIEEEK